MCKARSKDFAKSERVLRAAVCSVCDPANIFFTSKFSYVLFCDPATRRTESGTENGRGTTNSKPPGLIIMMGQSETLSSS
jgi:hypothetical protein